MKDFETTLLIGVGRPDNTARSRLRDMQASPATFESANQRVQANEDLITHMKGMQDPRKLESSDPATKVELAKLLDEARFQGIHAFSKAEEPWRLRMQQQVLERYKENPIDTEKFEIMREVLKNPEAKFSDHEGQRISKLLEQYKDVPEETKEELLSYLNEQLEEAEKAENEIRESAASKMLPKGQEESVMKSYEATYDDLERQRTEIRRLINVLEGRT